MPTIGWLSYAVKKRGEKVKWQRRKRAKTVNNLVLCENKYNILAISDYIDGNHHDSFELNENMQAMLDSLDKEAIDYYFSHLNADSGFGVKSFIELVENHKMIANIKQNKRNSKKKGPILRYMSDLIYANRFKIEVVFAWLDTY